MEFAIFLFTFGLGFCDVDVLGGGEFVVMVIVIVVL